MTFINGKSLLLFWSLMDFKPIEMYTMSVIKLTIVK